MPRIPFIFTMSNKKAQMDMRELVLTLVIVGVTFIVGTLIFSNVSNTTANILDSVPNTVTNESIAMTETTNTIVNETITMASGTGTTGNTSVKTITFFGNATHSTDGSSAVTLAIDTEVNNSKSGVIRVNGTFDNGDYNISYTYSTDLTGTAANTNGVTTLNFFGNTTNSSDLASVTLREHVNITSLGVVNVDTLQFDPGTYNISYIFDTDSAGQATIKTLNTTILDSFSLGVIALIVLAAIVILGILFKLGSQ